MYLQFLSPAPPAVRRAPCCRTVAADSSPGTGNLGWVGSLTVVYWQAAEQRCLYTVVSTPNSVE